MKYLPFVFCFAASTAIAEITWDEELYNGALRVNPDTPPPVAGLADALRGGHGL
ncbi:hypothetical protein N9571_01270 [Yoonia sp.]|nr:hypothetical protein [Yoonia sp.]